MTYCKPALAHGLNGWNAPQCATAVANARRDSRHVANRPGHIADILALAVRVDPETGRVSVWA